MSRYSDLSPMPKCEHGTVPTIVCVECLENKDNKLRLEGALWAANKICTVNANDCCHETVENNIEEIRTAAQKEFCND